MIRDHRKTMHRISPKKRNQCVASMSPENGRRSHEENLVITPPLVTSSMFAPGYDADSEPALMRFETFASISQPTMHCAPALTADAFRMRLVLPVCVVKIGFSR